MRRNLTIKTNGTKLKSHDERKTLVTISVDPDVLNFFSQDYKRSARMNAALREYMLANPNPTLRR